MAKKKVTVLEQVQDVFSQDWQDRQLVVPIKEDELALQEVEVPPADKPGIFIGKGDDSSGKAVEILGRVAGAYLTLGGTELVIWSIKGAKYGLEKLREKRAGEKAAVAPVLWRFPGEHLRAAVDEGFLQEPEGGFSYGTVYAGHPKRSEMYAPVQDFHRMLFRDRNTEITNICSALAAARLVVTHTIESTAGRGFEAGLDAMGDLFGRLQGATREVRSSKQETWYSSESKPTHAPFVPEENELRWYPSEPEWQQMVTDRLYRGQTKINLQIRSQQDYQVNRRLAAALKGIGFTVQGKWSNYEHSLLTVEGEWAPLAQLPELKT